MSFYTRGIQRDTSLNKGVLEISSDTYGGNTWPPRANILPFSIVFHELHLVVLSLNVGHKSLWLWVEELFKDKHICYTWALSYANDLFTINVF